MSLIDNMSDITFKIGLGSLRFLSSNFPFSRPSAFSIRNIRQESALTLN